jgi:hypothetical protein
MGVAVRTPCTTPGSTNKVNNVDEARPADHDGGANKAAVVLRIRFNIAITIHV